MKLGDFFEELAYGELSDLSLAEGNCISPEGQPKIVIALNDTLSQLHTKYVIKLEDIIIPLLPDEKKYSIDGENSVKIIYAYPDDVYTEDDFYKKKAYFNVRGNNLIFINEPKMESFNISYQWKPSRLFINPMLEGFEDQVIEIDSVYLPLVRLLVASAIYQNMGGEHHKNTGIGLVNKAQFVQSDLELSGALTTSVAFENKRFRANGFT